MPKLKSVPSGYGSRYCDFINMVPVTIQIRGELDHKNSVLNKKCLRLIKVRKKKTKWIKDGDVVLL